jgi:hypothetical protein
LLHAQIFIFCSMYFHLYHKLMIHVLWEKTEIVPPSTTDGFPRQRHVVLLKLWHVATIFYYYYYYYFEALKNHGFKLFLILWLFFLKKKKVQPRVTILMVSHVADVKICQFSMEKWAKVPSPSFSITKYHLW